MLCAAFNAGVDAVGYRCRGRGSLDPAHLQTTQLMLASTGARLKVQIGRVVLLAVPAGQCLHRNLLPGEDTNKSLSASVPGEDATPSSTLISCCVRGLNINSGPYR